MPPKFYNLADQELFKKYQYLPQEKYRLGLNLPTQDDNVVTDEGIVNTNAFANAGGGGDFNAITDFSYSPYVPNTSENTANTFTPNYDYGITSDPVEMEGAYYGTPKSMVYNPSTGRFQPSYDYKESPTFVNETLRSTPDVFNINETGDPALNEESIMVQGSNPYGEDDEEETGFFSNIFGKGKNAALTSLGLSAIMPPQLSIPLGILKGFASKSSGPKSLQSKYTVDNAGYGNTGMRDEYGLFTGQRNDGLFGIFGDPTGPDYTNRMAERIDELQDFYNSDKIQEKYGLGNIDLENDVLDEATYNKIKNINSTYAKQVLDYQKRLRNEAIEAGVDPTDIIDNIKIAKTNEISNEEAKGIQDAIKEQNEPSGPGMQDAGNPGGTSGAMTSENEGYYCFDPSTPVQMADGSEKKIKEIQLGDQTKGGEVTGVFQFKATDEIHDYKGVTVAGSHYVKEDGRFIMVKDSPFAVKIDKIPVVYSLDTSGRRIFINDIEFADYNGDGVAKNFLSNAGVDLSGFDKEVLRQVENRLI
jgi:hypothetical protein